tara:strand:- start:106 stop:486 length:381 start_codon:yes stop_codon:yes gene_type:complete
MADFTNNQIKNTYQRVLQHDTSGVVQNGTGSANLGDVHISGSLYHTGSINVSGNATIANITGSSTVAGTLTANEGLFAPFHANPQTISNNVSVPANNNGLMLGPITVGAGITLTVAANAKLKILDI